jgi:hypothetical protein
VIPLEELQRARQDVIALRHKAERRMLSYAPGSSAGRAMYELVQRLDRRDSELYHAIRNHPDHSYDGL